MRTPLPAYAFAKTSFWINPSASIYTDKSSSSISNALTSRVRKPAVPTGKGLHSDVEKNPYVSKDLSILKYSVPEFIENNKSLTQFIIEITDAKIEDGGSGAFYVYLKNKNKFK